MTDLSAHIGRFSKDAVSAVQVGSAESRDLGHYYLGVEHLVLGLCHVLPSDLAAVFKSAEVDPRAVSAELRGEVGRGPRPKWGTRLILTPRINTVFTVAEKLAGLYEEAEIRPAHLLLAVLVEGASIPAVLLARSEAARRLQEQLVERLERRRALPSAAAARVGAVVTPALNRFGRDFTALARAGKLAPVIGREREMLDVIRILARQTKCNPLLVGEPGVGKTCIVEALARHCLRDDAPEPLRRRRIVGVAMSDVVGGASHRGEFEERLNEIVREATSCPDIILFIDEIHTVMGAGAGPGPLDAANALKPALSRGDLRCIGATTSDEYRRYVERDGALERRFEIVRVDEPTRDQTLDILRGLRPSLEAHHDAAIADETLAAAVHLGACYIPDRRFPDKALDLVDRACAEVRIDSLVAGAGGRRAVPPAAVARIVARHTGIPADHLERSDSLVLLGLKSALQRQVVGQPGAIDCVVDAIVAGRQLGRDRRPVGVFLFVGPSGVGKTELALALAQALFGSEQHLVRLDMSEYMERHAVSRLVGAPPGYIGHDEEGQLTGAVRRCPHSVVLLDEVEKAHPDAMNMFLQLFDSGRLTDNRGRVVDFSHTVVIMTSNLGIAAATDEVGIRQNRTLEPEAAAQAQTRAVRKAVEGAFRNELLNRIDEVVHFKALDDGDVRAIIDRLLDDVRAQLSNRAVALEVSDDALGLIAERGFSPRFGARELKRTLDRLVRKPLAQLLLAEHEPGMLVHVTRDDEILRCVRKEGIA